MKPRIGITAEINPVNNLCAVNHEYALAVAAAGGVPFLMAPLSDSPSYVEDVLSQLDGVLLAGGGDISPRAYGESQAHPAVADMNEPRDYFEFQVARRAFVLGLPTLGVCRGLQVMNVALGGTLYQDLSLISGVDEDMAAMHKQEKPYQRAVHEVSIAPGSMLHAMYREQNADGCDGPLSLFVNSMHHQAVRDVAPLLEPVATWKAALEATSTNPPSPSETAEIIEAVEGKGTGFYLGVQWHPEYLGNATPLFLKFIQAAKG